MHDVYLTLSAAGDVRPGVILLDMLTNIQLLDLNIYGALMNTNIQV